MKHIDFFAGVGGFSIALKQAGFELAGYCEIDKFAVKSFNAIHDLKEGDVWYAKDIKEVKPEEVPKADIYTAGFPCQDVSISGRQRGLNGERSGLFFEFIRILKGKKTEDKPRWLIIENVANLLSISDARDFTTVLTELWEAGYDCEWQIVNSKDYVPQNRVRIYIVGHLGGRSCGKIFPLTRSNPKTIEQIIGGSQGMRVYCPYGVSVTLTADGGGKGGRTGLYFIDLNKNPKITSVARCIKARYNAGITNRQCDNSGVIVCPRAVITPERLNKRQNGRRMKECNEPMFCLTTQDRHGIMLCECENCILHIKEATKKGFAEAACGDSVNLAFPDSKTRRGRVGKEVAQTLVTSANQGVVMPYGRIRRLTPKEAFRLQGYSDDCYYRAAAVCSENQLYKQMGNSITIHVVLDIALKIMEVEKNGRY